MLTRFIKIQLVLFTILTVIALVVLGWYYLRVPSLVGIGQYKLYADLPRSGGLYATANVTYRGTKIGKVTAVEPTENGARGDDEHRQPATRSRSTRRRTCTRCRRSVSSTWTWCRRATPASTSAKDRTRQTIDEGTVPSEIGPALDAANRGLAVLPKEKIDQLLDETSQAVGGLGPRCSGWSTRTTNIAQDFKDNLPQVNDIIENSAPILDSQVELRRRDRAVGAQPEHHGGAVRRSRIAALRSGLQQAAPTLDQVTTVFSDVRDSLPQTLANLEVVIDMLKRYHKGLEQTLVFLPQGAAIAQAGTSFDERGPAAPRRCRSTSRRRA